jgi:hypothetical protein
MALLEEIAHHGAAHREIGLDADEADLTLLCHSLISAALPIR